MRNLRPIAICILLLLLPLLYVGSYFAMVIPLGGASKFGGVRMGYFQPKFYRFGGKWADGVYGPLERIDRKLFPERWLDRNEFQTDTVR